MLPDESTAHPQQQVSPPGGSAEGDGTIDLSLALEGISNVTADHQEGINAFRERREPKYLGR